MQGYRFKCIGPAAAITLLMGVLWLAGPSARLSAQTTGAAAGSHTQPSAQQQDLAKQIEALRAQLAQLQTAIDQQRQSGQQRSAPAPASPNGMPKGEMDKMGMGMMGQMDQMREMDSMKPGAMSGTAGCCMGMDMHKGEMGMPPDGMKMPQGMMMQGMSGMSSGSKMAPGAGTTTSADTRMNMGANAPTSPMSPSRSMSALPGVPGASHLYHIGATGFFLDQPHVTLTGQQQSALNVIKERALLDRANSDRRIEQGEQELWTLTAADQPDAAGIQAKVREIEQLRTNQRLAFIQNIGEATKVLTLEQRTQLLGMVGMSAK
jgi:hypothetical protein